MHRTLGFFLKKANSVQQCSREPHTLSGNWQTEDKPASSLWLDRHELFCSFDGWPLLNRKNALWFFDRSRKDGYFWIIHNVFISCPCHICFSIFHDEKMQQPLHLNFRGRGHNIHTSGVQASNSHMGCCSFPN